MEKRRCNNPNHSGARYLPVVEFHKLGRRNGKQQYRTECRTCYNRDHPTEGGWPKDKKYAYQRARSRALTRLSKLAPELYAMCLATELQKEELFTQVDLDRIAKRNL